MLSKNPSIVSNPSAIKSDCRWGDRRGVLMIMIVQILRGLEHSSALNHSEDQYDDRDDEQNMDQPSHRVCRDHAEQP